MLSGGRQECVTSSFLFNLVTDGEMEIALGQQHVGVEMADDEKVCDLDYADDLVLFRK